MARVYCDLPLPLPAREEERKSAPLEILHGALVLLRGGAAGKGAEIAPLASLRIYFARIEPVFAGRKFANHGADSCVMNRVTAGLVPRAIVILRCEWQSREPRRMNGGL